MKHKHIEKCKQLKKEIALYLKHVAGWNQLETEKMSFADTLTRAYVMGIPSLKPLVATLYSVFGEISAKDIDLLDAPVTGVSNLLSVAKQAQYKESDRAYVAYFIDKDKKAAAIAWKDGRLSVFVERTYSDKKEFDTIQILDDRLVTLQVLSSLDQAPRLTGLLASENPEFLS
jgi:hypothetical protein